MAAVDYFLKVDGIQGESQNKTHKDEIQVLSWQIGGKVPVSATGVGGMAGGKVKFAELVITKVLDKSSPKLLKALCGGQHIKTATLSCCKAGTGNTSSDFVVIKLSDIMISGLEIRTGGAHPSSENSTESKDVQSKGHTQTEIEAEIEELKLAFSKIEYEYKSQGKDGTFSTSATMSYDVPQNLVG